MWKAQLVIESSAKGLVGEYLAIASTRAAVEAQANKKARELSGNSSLVCTNAGIVRNAILYTEGDFVLGFANVWEQA